MNKKQTSNRSIWKYALMLPVVAVLLFFNSTFQTKAEPVNEMNTVQQDPVASKDKPLIFSHVEVMPQYPGREAALMKFLADNITYPTKAAEQGIQGRVTLRFVITPDGSIENIEVMKSLDSLCDKEAIRVVKKMPKWIPGKQNGETVSVYYSLPITFRLQGSANPAKPASEPNGITVTTYDVQNTQNVVIEVDGKVMSKEEWKNVDPKTIESIAINKDVTPNRIMVATKKK